MVWEHRGGHGRDEHDYVHRRGSGGRVGACWREDGQESVVAQPQGARERGSDLDSVAAESGGCCVGMVLGEEIELRWELRLGGGLV